MYHYVVTPQATTSVTHAVRANFTSPNDVNLIIEKGSRLEVHLLTPSGIHPVAEFDLFAEIRTLAVFRPPKVEKDLLFVSTTKFQYAVFEYNSSSGELISRKSGDFILTDGSIDSWDEPGPKVTVSQSLKFIAHHAYFGQVRIIAYNDNGDFEKETEYQFNDFHVHEMNFAEGTETPTLIFLTQCKGKKVVKVYEINPAEKDLVSANWEIPAYDTTVDRIIGLPTGGAILLGPRHATYFDKTSHITLPTLTSNVTSYGKLDKDGSSYLIGDNLKRLYVLNIKYTNNKVSELSLDYLGETSRASSIVNLDNNYVFIGSRHADSQLIILKKEINEKGSHVEVQDTYTNLGPIHDFAVADFEKKGLNQIVTCSGLGLDGSLRVVKTGVGSIEQASVELSGVRGVWSLKNSQQDQYDKYLVVSFVGQTRLLTGDAETLGEAIIEGFLNDQQTLYCANVNDNQLLQITSNSIRLIDATTHQLTTEYKPESSVLVGSSTNSQVVAALSGGVLLYFQIANKQLSLVSQTKVEHEVACITVSSNGQSEANFCVIGLWTDISLRILELPSLNQIHTEAIGGEVVPRSLLISTFEESYLFCGLADGRLVYFAIDLETKKLRDRKRMTFGTQPISLTQFSNSGTTHVFVSSDRPTIIHSSNKKLTFSSVNLKKVNYMTPFHTESLKDSITFTTDTALTIGNIDNIQKLYIKTIPLGETPRKIIYHNSHQAFVVLTSIFVATDNGVKDVYKVKVFDDQTFEVVSQFELDEYEVAKSITLVKFQGKPNEYIAVGTSMEPPNTEDPTNGNIRLFEIGDKKQIKLVATARVKGSVWALAPYRDNLLASITDKIQMFNFTEEKEDVKAQLVGDDDCRSFRPSNILIVQFITRGTLVIAADCMLSTNLFQLDTSDQSLDTVARHCADNWMTDVQSLEDNYVIGAEQNGNLFVVQFNSTASGEELETLVEVGRFHVGNQKINRFQLGSLVPRDPDSEYKDIHSSIFVTSAGSIGVVASISKEDYAFFEQLQSHLQGLRSIGGFTHQAWRSYNHEKRRLEPALNFIDGDLIESYLELSTGSMEEIAHLLNTTTSEISKRIKNLSRALH